MEGGPQVPLVSKPSALACRAERLAGAGACPEGQVVGPVGEAHGKCPAADAGKEVAVSVAHKVAWDDILDAPFVYVPGRNLASRDQFA